MDCVTGGVFRGQSLATGEVSTASGGPITTALMHEVIAMSTDY